MRTYNFYHKNSSALLTLSAETFDEAEKELTNLLKDTYGWRVEDEEGESEEDNFNDPFHS